MHRSFRVIARWVTLTLFVIGLFGAVPAAMGAQDTATTESDL